MLLQREPARIKNRHLEAMHAVTQHVNVVMQHVNVYAVMQHVNAFMQHVNLYAVMQHVNTVTQPVNVAFKPQPVKDS